MKFTNIFNTRLRVNMLSGVITSGAAFLISAIKFPLYIHFLGYEKYGIWLLLSTILTFAQLGLIGIGPALIKLVAAENEQGNALAVQEYITTALTVLTLFGIGILTIAILFKWNIISLLGLRGKDAELAAGLFVYIGLLSVEVLLYQVLNAALSGLGRMDLSNYFQVAVQVIPLLGSVPLLLMGKGVWSLLIGETLGYFIMSIINFMLLKRILGLELIAPKNFSWNRVQILISFGGRIFAGSMLSMITLPLSKIAITRFAGVGDVPIFEVAYRTGLQVRGILEIAMRAIMPEVSRINSAGTKESYEKLNKLNLKANKLIWVVAPLLYTILFIFADLIFKLWFGTKYQPAMPEVFRIMLIGSFFNIIGIVTYYNLMGKGMVREIFLYHFITATGILFLLGFIVFISVNLSVSSASWCYVIGAGLGTVYLLYVQRTMNKIPI